MQKRSKRFGLIGLVAMAICLMAALFLVSGCGSETKDTSEATLKPSDSEPAEKVVLPTEPFYVLVVGNDSRADTYEASDSAGNPYSDTIMLVRVDPVNYQVTAVTVPRDTKIWIDGTPVKLNDSYSRGGIDGLLDQIEWLTGVRPEYYLDMGFADFVKFIDALGGVTVDVPVEMSFKDVMTGEWIYLDPGEQDLTGQEALVFSRVRKIFYNSDASRQNDDRSVVASLINYIANNPDKVKPAVQAMYDNMESNWEQVQFEGLVEDFAKNADKLVILSGTGPWDGDIDEESGLWMVPRDEETWAQLIETVNAGGDPNEVVYPADMSLG